MDALLKKMRNPEELGLPPVGADSHAHLDGKGLYENFEEVLERAKAAGVALIGNVFLDIEVWKRTRERFEAHPEIFFILGHHPIDAASWEEGHVERMREVFVSEPKFKAVGETGLDYYWKDATPEQQKRAFLAQAALARDLGLPLVIHCRDAEEDTLNILEGLGMEEYPVLWHCFGGAAGLVKRIVGNGWHVSVAGPVTYPANNALREALPFIPPDRLHVETDSPYLSPQNRRGKMNEPANVAFTAAAIADCLGMDRAELWRICGENTRRFFKV